MPKRTVCDTRFVNSLKIQYQFITKQLNNNGEIKNLIFKR